MPDPIDAIEEAARLVARAYAQAEADLIALLARRSAAGTSSGYDVWATRKLAETRALRAAALRRIAELETTIVRLLSESIGGAAQQGLAAASTELVAAGITAPLISGTPAAVIALAEETVAGVTSTHIGMLRQTTDAYRDVQAVVAARVATGSTTLPQAIDLSLRSVR